MEQRPPRVPKLAWVQEEEEEEGPGAAPEVETEEMQEFQPLEEGWESVGDLEQRPPRVPKLAWVEKEEEEGPGAVPEVETEEVQEFQPLEEDAAVDQTQEQDLACGLFHKTPAQEETSVMGTGSMEDGDVYTSDTSAAMLEFILEEGVSIPEQVPAMVRYIHQCLMANESADSRLGRTLLDLTEAQPADVVTALLRVAPTCDRAAVTMWKTIMCSSRTVEPVMQILLDVLRTWPEHSKCTSDGDNTGVFALAVSFCNWPLLTPWPTASPTALFPPSPTASPCFRDWAETWPRGSFRGTRRGAPQGFPLALPCRAQALPHRYLGTGHYPWVLCPL
ncbi:uncharacterized protein LOC111945827, partial [Cyanistes caeruleus]|uniref:uncharacterized protein LOC111945827 n=1 Tax=Cyanistes caeruleus TaxID=156563 RepID=UPI000CDAE8D4